LNKVQILVISLVQSTQRREKVIQELSKISLPWRFLDAVDGRKLHYPIPEYPAKKVKKLLGFDLTPNEIGCFLSHRQAWSECLSQNITTIIFEDDFVLLPHFENVIETLLSQTENWGLVRLQAIEESRSHTIQSFPEYSLVRNDGDPLGATSYIVQPKIAKILLEHATQVYEPLDHFLEHYQKHDIPMLAIKPYPVDITRVESTIADRPNDRKPIKGFKKNMRSINRKLDRWLSKEPWFPK